MESNDQIPALVEPLFQWMGANVNVIPVMNFDDVKRGLQNNRNKLRQVVSILTRYYYT
jgi:hypothetical protein